MESKVIKKPVYSSIEKLSNKDYLKRIGLTFLFLALAIAGFVVYNLFGNIFQDELFLNFETFNGEVILTILKISGLFVCLSLSTLVIFIPCIWGNDILWIYGFGLSLVFTILEYTVEMVSSNAGFWDWVGNFFVYIIVFAIYSFILVVPLIIPSKHESHSLKTILFSYLVGSCATFLSLTLIIGLMTLLTTALAYTFSGIIIIIIFILLVKFLGIIPIPILFI